MTGYPPRCRQNGTRHHIVAEHQAHQLPFDVWPGDTVEYISGDVWRMNRDGRTYTQVVAPKVRQWVA